MAAYHPFTSSRQTRVDLPGLLGALRTAIASDVGIQVGDDQHYTLKKTTPWTPAEIAAAQTLLDTAPADTPQLQAQHGIDAMAIFEKAIVLTILDQFNLVRSKLQPPLAAITVQQMIDAIRVKAGTL